MNDLAVRPAETGDIEAIAALAQARPYTAKWSARELSYELDRLDSVFLVGGAAGKVRGYALARVAEKDCLLLDLAAASDGGGCGRALMSALTRAAMARGCARISFEVSAANERALAFYAKAGAHVVGRRPKFYNDGSDAVLMDLNIP
ncbi:MAG: N-acetyltransferase [Elusimicrobia bacterium]|nr:N-acetyltransferase [Elusimicrobiota bacterium]